MTTKLGVRQTVSSRNRLSSLNILGWSRRDVEISIRVSKSFDVYVKQMKLF